MIYNNKGAFEIKDSWANQDDILSQNLSKKANQPPNIDPSSLPSILNQAGKKSLSRDSSKNAKMAKNIQNNSIQNQQIDESMSHNESQDYMHRIPQNKLQKMNEIEIMAQRMSRLEITCNNQREEIKEKLSLIQTLYEELNYYKKDRAGSQSLIEENKTLKNLNQGLKKENQEIKQFLADYGLVWKGYDNAKKSDFDHQAIKDKAENQKKGKVQYNLPKEIDINIILKRVEELNIIMEKDGCTEIYKDEFGVHKFRKMDNLPIGFYADGIVIAGYPFYKYGSNEALQVLADVLDGYFPYMLKQKYPDGTLLKVIDKTEEAYSSEKSKGPQNLKNLELDQLKSNSQGKENSIQGQNNEEKKQKFLSQSPTYQEKLNDKRLKAFKHKIEPDGSIIPFTQEQIKFDNDLLSDEEKENLCLLKVRTENGNSRIILRLDKKQLFSKLYHIVKDFSETDNFEIFSVFDKRVIEKNSIDTLEQLELHPSAALNMREKK